MCSILFPCAAEMTLSALSKRVLFDNHTAYLTLGHSHFSCTAPWIELREVHLSFSVSTVQHQVAVTACGSTVVSEESRRQLLTTIESIEICLLKDQFVQCASTSLPLCPQTPLRRTVKTPRPRQTPPQTPPPRCSTAGVTTWAPRVEGSPSGSSITMATMATLATASPSPGRSQIYDRTGQSVDRCVHCSLINWSRRMMLLFACMDSTFNGMVLFKSWLCYSRFWSIILLRNTKESLWFSLLIPPSQVQKHVIFIRSSSAQRHLHLCQRGLVGVAALRPHSHPEDSVTPAQRDHTGRWPQQQP